MNKNDVITYLSSNKKNYSGFTVKSEPREIIFISPSLFNYSYSVYYTDYKNNNDDYITIDFYTIDEIVNFIENKYGFENLVKEEFK